MKEAEMVVIGECIAKIITQKQAAMTEVKAAVAELTKRFPLYDKDVLV
jgi:glycine/serine hydroxymethyltransferase